MLTERLTVSIGGMTCPSCVSTIEEALQKREGVIGAEVNLAGQQAVITYDPYSVAPRQVVDLVESLGYQAPKWTAVRSRGSASTV